MSEDKEEIKVILKSLLVPAKFGLTLPKLLAEFKQKEGYEFPYSQFGYLSASEFLDDCPDICYTTFENGIQIYKGIAGADAAHIARMVSRQAGSKKTYNIPRIPAASKKKVVPPRFCAKKPVTPFIPLALETKIVNFMKMFVKDGIKMDNFMKFFLKETGQALNYERYGFSSAEQFFKGISELSVFNKKGGGFFLKLRSACQTETDPSSIKNVENDNVFSHRNDTNDFNQIHDKDIALPSDGLNPKVKKNFLDLLKNNPSGIWASRFCAAYEDATGNKLILKELGHFSVIDMASTLSDIFDVERPLTKDKDWLLFAKRSEQNATVKQAVKVSLEDLAMKLDKMFGLSKSSLPLINCPSVFQQVNGTPLQPFLNEFGSLETVISNKLNHKFHIDRAKGALVKGPKSALPKSAAVQESLPAFYPPSDIATIEDYYKKVKLPLDDAHNDGYLEIWIGHVKNPHMFWFFLNGEEYNGALQTVMDQLETFYCGPDGYSYILPDQALMVGLPCVGLFPQDNNWHRCTILAIKDANTVSVSYVDYGTTDQVKKSSLRYIKKEFMELPAQAMPGSLASIEPIVEGKWTPEASSFFLGLVKEKVIVAKVKHRSALLTSMTLCDTSIPDQDIFINDELVHHGFAKFSKTSTMPTASPFQTLFPNNMLLPLLQSMDYSNPLMSNQNPLMTTLLLQLLNQPLDPQLLGALSAVNQQSNNLELLQKANDILNYTKQSSSSPCHSSYNPSLDARSRSESPALSPTRCLSRNSSVPNKEAAIVKQREELKDKPVSSDSESDFEIPNMTSSGRRYVKRVKIRDNAAIHIINYEDNPYMTSSEISSFFWQKDILRRMLRALNFKCSFVTLDIQTHPAIFQQMASFDIPGIGNNSSKKIKEYAFLYHLQHIPEILAQLKHNSSHLKEDLEQELSVFDPKDSYWLGDDGSKSSDGSSDSSADMEDLTCALNSLLLERKKLMETMFKDENFKASEKLKQIEGQLDLVKSKINEMRLSACKQSDSAENRSTPDGADESKPSQSCLNNANAPSNLHASAPSNLHVSAPSNLHASAPSNLHASAPPNLHASTPSNLHASAPPNLHVSTPSHLHARSPPNLHVAASNLNAPSNLNADAPEFVIPPLPASKPSIPPGLSLTNVNPYSIQLQQPAVPNMFQGAPAMLQGPPSYPAYMMYPQSNNWSSNV